MKTKSMIFLVSTSLGLGLVISAASGFAITNKIAPNTDLSWIQGHAVCDGPDVVGYRCPDTTTYQRGGFPIHFYASSYNTYSTSPTREESQGGSIAVVAFLLNALIWFAVVIAAQLFIKDYQSNVKRKSLQ